MYGPDELRGLNTMMPAFAKDGATDLEATDTVDVDRLADGVDKMIRAGADIVSTTGSFGEFHTLTWEEFQTLVTATLDTVKKRVPVFVGVTSMNGREVVRKIKFVRQVGGEGVFTGVPFYYPPTVENTIQFYHDIAEMFPDTSIQIYHNPPLHRIHIPVRAFPELVKHRNIVSMKDSHRSPLEFMRLMDIVKGKISVFTNQMQFYPYGDLGARGFWSTDAWMGPWPLLQLRNAVYEGDAETAKQVLREIQGISAGEHEFGGPEDNARKLASTDAGFCNLGPNRSPFVVVKPESLERARKRAAGWKALCEKYRPEVEARQKVAVAV